MEYFSRILNCATERMQFRYHPLCKEVRLTHLMFADDLLLFCKGDASSIMVLLRAFSSFSSASGLKMSPSKSNVFFNGVKEGVKKEILTVSGFSEGCLPFRYLGVPIITGRLKKSDCSVLIDKVVARVRSFGAKRLSYAGRLVLVQSVLSTLYNYWASMFLLPKGVLVRLELICRNFLWDGGVDNIRVPSVSWEKVCRPKQEGGLGLKQSVQWNKALVGKLVWWLAVKADRLWVRWVHHIYMKGVEWSEYSPSGDVSWYWRKVCHVKECFKDCYVDGSWVFGPCYTVQNGYRWLVPRGDLVPWYKYIWSSLVVPKHAVIAWFIHVKGMMLKDRLFKFGVSLDNVCCICGLQVETHDHLFTHCVFCVRVVRGVCHWPGVDIGDDDWLQRIACHRWSKSKKMIINMAILTCWYFIWYQRNRARLFLYVEWPDNVINCIKACVRNRVNVSRIAKWSAKDEEWWSTKM